MKVIIKKKDLDKPIKEKVKKYKEFMKNLFNN